MRSALPVRWVIYGVFVLSSTLNFLDRQLLPALAPALYSEFELSHAEYGWVVAAFSLSYSLLAPAAGWMIDRVGLSLGATLAVAGWSLAGMITGAARSAAGLAVCRALLGAFQAGGIPATGKANAVCLKPEERALGSAVSQIGLTAGFVAAPLLAAWVSPRWGWRLSFVFAGALGFLWIPLWWLAARRIPSHPKERAAERHRLSLWRSSSFWTLLAANILLMSGYALWTNWTTVFLVDRFGMTQEEANRTFAWIPPIFASLGGLTGGWLSWRWAAGAGLVRARMRAILAGASGMLVTALVPLSPSAVWAVAWISLSYFACVLASVNLYALPLDLFGAARAATSTGGLTAAYGWMQAAFSPLAGASIDRFGWLPVCVVAAALPLIAFLLLRAFISEEGR